MKRSILSCLVVLFSMFAVVSYTSAITNGEPDSGRHPYVGVLVFDYALGAPGWRCSGSLIAPTVVLTAGHCTEGAVAARIWFDEDVTYDNVPFPLYPYGGPGSGAIEGKPYTNPDYRSDENPYGGGNGLPAFSYRDIGVVVLDEAIELDEYAELPGVGFVDTLPNKTNVDVIGYGVQEMHRGGGPPYWGGLRVRLFAPSQLISGKFVHSDEFLRLTMNPGRGKGGMCFGDSGGPDLLSGSALILGVNSYVTNYNCAGVGYSSRIDIPEVLEWIDTFFPVIDVAPAAVMTSQGSNVFSTQTLTITNSGGSPLNWNIVEDDSACDSPTDISWLSVAPDTGTTDLLESTVVDVTVDSMGLASGEYTANLCVNSNDPVTPVVQVSVTLTVE